MKSKIFNVLKYAALIAIIFAAGRFAYLFYFPNLPKSVQVFDVMHLNDAAWSTDEKQYYYHTDQGSRLMPLSWYVNLEDLGSKKLFNTPGNLSRFRMIPDPVPVLNEYRLPIGFAVTPKGPVDSTDYVGISCATCHTGQLNYKGLGLRIDGGSGMIDFDKFIADMIGSLVLTISPLRPAKFDRFARRIYGENVTSDEKDQLKKAIESYIATQGKGLLKQRIQTFKQGGKNTATGFGRIDALGQGGNALYQNFSYDNLVPLDAPVGIPVLWYTHQYDWVQLNGSIRQPLSRNIIEALAVNALVTVPGTNNADYKSPEDLYMNNIDMYKMYKLEDAVSKLKAPVWPEDILGVLDQDLAKKGKALYTENCAECHAKKYEPDYGYWYDQKKFWPPFPGDSVSKKYKKRYYELRMFNVDKIGTDPTDAVNFATRTINAKSFLSQLDPKYVKSKIPNIDTLDIEHIPGAFIIPMVIDGVMAKNYDELEKKWATENPPIIGDSATDYQKAKWNGFRQSMWQAAPVYPARPLSGIWTSAPYLHNNSVPNLYQLLSPVEERSEVFWTGDLEYDPEKVGYLFEKFQGGSKMDTKIKGNSNLGHEFTDNGNGRQGVIGRGFSHEEKMALIEYLKQLTFDQEGYEKYFPNSEYAKKAREEKYIYTPYGESAYDTSSYSAYSTSVIKDTSSDVLMVSKDEKEAIAEFVGSYSAGNR